jgi:hypothetical protein
MFARGEEDCMPADERAIGRLAFSNDLLAEISAGDARARPLLGSDRICRSGRCSVTAGDAILYRDNNHLSDEGASLVFGPRLREEFRQALTRHPRTRGDDSASSKAR